MTGGNKDSNEWARYYYLERLHRLTELGDRLGSALDKAILTLSGGSLIFSMTFVERLAPHKLLLPLLFVSWAFFALAILSVIIAMRGAQNKVAAEGIQTSDVLKSLENVQSDPDLRVHPTGSIAINRNVWRWNVCAIICFIMGIVCLGVFVGWNLFESKKASSHRGISSRLQHRQESNLYAYTAPPVTK